MYLALTSLPSGLSSARVPEVFMLPDEIYILTLSVK